MYKESKLSWKGEFLTQGAFAQTSILVLVEYEGIARRQFAYSCFSRFCHADILLAESQAV